MTNLSSIIDGLTRAVTLLAAGGNPEEQRQYRSFLWIPVTPVVPAEGGYDWGGENDGVVNTGNYSRVTKKAPS